MSISRLHNFTRTRTPSATDQLRAGVSTSAVSLAMLTSIFFIFATAKGITDRRLSPMLYLFLLNRALADLLLASTKLPLHLHRLLPPEGDVSTLVRYSAYVGDKVFLLSFYTATATLCALSILKFVSISKPLIYKTKVTPFKCALLLVFIWLFILLLILSLVGVFEGFQCRLGPTKVCIKILVYIRVFLVVLLIGFYMLNIICYCLVAWLLARRQKYQPKRLVRQSSGVQKTAFFNIWLNFINFTFCYMPYLCFKSVEAVALTKEGLSQTIISRNCLKWAMFVVYLFTYLRIIIDNLIPLKTDSNFRKAALFRKPTPRYQQCTTTTLLTNALIGCSMFSAANTPLPQRSSSRRRSNQNNGHHPPSQQQRRISGYSTTAAGAQNKALAPVRPINSCPLNRRPAIDLDDGDVESAEHLLLPSVGRSRRKSGVSFDDDPPSEEGGRKDSQLVSFDGCGWQETTFV